jgi:HEAT repeats
MLEEFEKLRKILKKKLSDDEVDILLSELTIVFGEGSVSISGNANEAIIMIGDNNQVTINNGTNAEVMRDFFRSIIKNTKAPKSQSSDRINSSRIVANKTIGGKPLATKTTTHSKKLLNATQSVEIQKNINILNNLCSTVPDKITALKKLGSIAKKDSSAISWILSLIQRDKNNDVIAAGITALSRISDGRSSIISTIIRILRLNKSSLIIISAMNTFAKIAVDDSGAIDKMLDLLSNNKNATKIKKSIIDNLGKVANGNKKAIDQLISVMNSNQNLLIIRKAAANSLGQIAGGDRDTITAMKRLLAFNLSKDVKDCIAANLNKIDRGNSAVTVHRKASIKK